MVKKNKQAKIKIPPSKIFSYNKKMENLTESPKQRQVKNKEWELLDNDRTTI